MSWMETIPPMALITLAIMGMGHIQGWIHQGFYGKPKAVLVDSFDRKLAKRDGRILQQIREEEEARTGHKKSFFS